MVVPLADTEHRATFCDEVETRVDLVLAVWEEELHAISS
jgi:hypothetical protein